MSRDAETRIVRWLQAIFAVGVFALTITVVSASVSFRTKTNLEIRVEALELARLDQQKRNQATDQFLEELLNGKSPAKR